MFSGQDTTHFLHSEERNAKQYRNASQIVPILLDILPCPGSVVDIGGGQGAWCRALLDAGIPEAWCVDHPDTLAEGLLIPTDRFIGCNLEEKFPTLSTYDWALCLEVAEHLSHSRAQGLVRLLTDTSNYIVFSAAIPGQPGYGHINCQTPEYWRALFREVGYKRFDVIRPNLITNPGLSYWWKQNLFLFSNETGFSPKPCSWPVDHDDQVEIVSKKVNAIYLDAFRLSKRSLKRRILEKLVGKCRVMLDRSAGTVGRVTMTQNNSFWARLWMSWKDLVRKRKP